MVKFTEPTQEQLLYIADHLKKDDYREIVGLSGRTCVRDTLLLCARCSQWARVALFDGVPVGYTDPHKRYNDLYFGIRVTWNIPTYQRQPDNYYYY